MGGNGCITRDSQPEQVLTFIPHQNLLLLLCKSHPSDVIWKLHDRNWHSQLPPLQEHKNECAKREAG